MEQTPPFLHTPSHHQVKTGEVTGYSIVIPLANEINILMKMTESFLDYDDSENRISVFLDDEGIFLDDWENFECLSSIIQFVDLIIITQSFA